MIALCDASRSLFIHIGQHDSETVIRIAACQIVDSTMLDDETAGDVKCNFYDLWRQLGEIGAADNDENRTGLLLLEAIQCFKVGFQ